MKLKLKIHMIFQIVTSLIAVTSLSSTTTSGFDFLRTHMGARFSAIAGAGVAIPGDIHGIYYNPASLALVNRVVSATYLNHVLDFQSGFIAFAQQFNTIGAVGIGVDYIDYGAFDETDENGEKLGTFGANSFVISTAIGRPLLPNLYAGLTAKYIRASIDRFVSDAVAIDAGAIYRVPFIQDLDVGIAVLNLGKATSAFIDTKEELPLKVVLGFSKRLAHLPLLFNANIYKFQDDDFQFAIGGEFTLVEGAFLRLGYDSIGRDQKVGSDYDRIAGASIGFGFIYNTYQFDYSFSSMGQIGSLNRLTFSANF